MESKKFLSLDEVAAEFGLDADALKQFVDSGEVRALADRGTWKYRRDELQALADAGKISLPSLSDGDKILSFHNPDDDVSYIELDEDALAEQATMITKTNPMVPTADSDAEQNWFVPSDAAEMTVPPETSSSDVAIYSGPAASSDEVPSIAEGSDSDVRIASDYEAPRSEDSGILLDFNLDAGATVSSSGSSLRLPHGGDPEIASEEVAATDTGESAWDDVLSTPAASDSKVAGISAGESGVLGDSGGDSSVRLGGDSGLQMVDVTGSGAKMRAEESGILLDDGSHVGMAGGNSVLGRSLTADSGISLDSMQDDSGITIETSRDHGDDSGISLSTGDSGISLSSGDSGISLDGMDSGLSLGGADSGISMDLGGDSGIAVDGNARTMAEIDLPDDGDRTQTLNVRDEFDDDSAFDINLDDGDATAELLLGDDDDVDDTSATVVRKGRSKPGSLSAAFELDDAAEVEDLEISQDLDGDVEAEIEELSEDEEVFDASDETFSGDEVEAAEDDDYLEPAAKSKKAAGPREPAWGAGMTVGLVACSLFLAANSLILWSGVATMWNGADPEGPAATLIQTFGDLIK